MKYPWSSLIGFPKWLVICVAIFLVSAGLCGLQIAISSAVNSGTLTSIFMIPGFLELIGIWGSAAGIVICLVGWLVTSLYRSFTKKANPEILDIKSEDHDSREP